MLKRQQPSWRPRPRTVTPAHIQRLFGLAAARVEHWRPRTRADCRYFGRPCPFVGCRYHLFLEINGRGNISLRHPGVMPWELWPSCSLDVAEQEGLSLEAVGELLGVRKWQIKRDEERALAKLAEAMEGQREEIVDELRRIGKGR